MDARSVAVAVFTRRTVHAKHEFPFCGLRGDSSIKKNPNGVFLSHFNPAIHDTLYAVRSFCFRIDLPGGPDEYIVYILSSVPSQLSKQGHRSID